MGFFKTVSKALYDAAIEIINSKPDYSNEGESDHGWGTPAPETDARSDVKITVSGDASPLTTRCEETTETTSTGVDYPCGFSFKRIKQRTQTHYDVKTNKETAKRSCFILAGKNMLKVTRDLEEQCGQYIHLACSCDDGIPQVEDFLDFLAEHGASDATIAVEPPTKSGKPRKHPISVSLSSEEDSKWVTCSDGCSRDVSTSYIINLGYREDGTIGKGKYIYWRNNVGHLVEFSDNLLLRVSITDRAGGWTRLYDWKA